MEIDRVILFQIIIRIIIFLFFLFCSISFGVSEYRKSNSLAYKKSLELIRNNEQIKNILGDRIRRDWLLKGSPFPEKGTGLINFEFSVVGNNRAKVRVNAMQYEFQLKSISIVVNIKKLEKEIVITAVSEK